MNDEFIAVFNELTQILKNETIMWSLSPLTYKKFNKNQSSFTHFSVALYFNDFINLREKYSKKFKFDGWIYQNKTLSPYFVHDSKRIILCLIIPTCINKITQNLTKIEKLRLKYWGNNHKNLLLKIKGSRTKHIEIEELVNLFYIEKNTEFLITDESIYEFSIWNNLNWNNMQFFELNGVRFQYFAEYNKYLKFIEIK
ncbi:hypothetical protein EG856_02715 [Mycoplasmopsis phocirhinis]|uniref:Uncharacterized protein n=1 Tax=Mycoplasmopsis phocirhinis TaxID=142650 RepID=A0A4V0ZAI4_9BACT|nr:hypothetical protein [Mycoplasmopsis phocirhinis]QBF34812.1 hypothetical protein EG856_02715 [Mycoplasmopsis phocirhinis]